MTMSMTQRLVVALLLLAGFAAGPAHAQDDTAEQPIRAQRLQHRGLHFDLRPGPAQDAIITVRQGDREVLSIVRQSQEYESAGSLRAVFLADANFDGYPDIWILDGTSMVNNSYTLELFDPRTHTFAAVPGFSELSNPRADRRNRRITVSSRGGCCQHSNAIYRWRGTQLELIAEWGDSMPEIDWPGRDCYVRLWRRERQGDRIVDRPDRYVPMHVFGGQPRPSAECRNATPPPVAGR